MVSTTLVSLNGFGTAIVYAINNHDLTMLTRKLPSLATSSESGSIPESYNVNFGQSTHISIPADQREAGKAAERMTESLSEAMWGSLPVGSDSTADTGQQGSFLPFFPHSLVLTCHSSMY